jgi:3-oxoacyl-[acyl-carrier-protein] synthase II
VFGDRVPVSSTKGFTGHTLGACGAIEAAFCIAMMNEGWLAPNRKLERVDPRCAALDYVRGTPREQRIGVAMTNNFAFGGINTSLVLGKV